MTVSIGTVWDRAVEVLRGRAGILGPVAALAVFLPTVVNNAFSTFVPRTSVAAALIAALIALAVLVANIWGQLAMLAVATHPATTRADAGRQATARLLPAIGIVVVVGIVLSLAIVPPIVALAQAGVDFSRMGTAAGPAAMPTIPAGVGGFVVIYMIAFVVAAFWLGARLLLLNPVILNERRGLGSVTRSIRLTQGLTWRLIGVMMLFVVVLLVAASAVQFVVALPLRLALGADALPVVLFFASIAGAAVTTVFTVIAAAFTAQLYVATAGEPAVV
jgi:hypothetical protein